MLHRGEDSHDARREACHAAVDQDKQRELTAMAREYLRHLPDPCPWRLDIVSVYKPATSIQPEFELFQNVLAVA